MRGWEIILLQLLAFNPYTTRNWGLLRIGLCFYYDEPGETAEQRAEPLCSGGALSSALLCG